ncbi:MAG: hypothetical protein NTZ73_02970 [Candidatus Diapherotrites archaeon]|nr:hypothetical protein [Candidatus Diapherotrites archaeon]
MPAKIRNWLRKTTGRSRAPSAASSYQPHHIEKRLVGKINGHGHKGPSPKVLEFNNYDAIRYKRWAEREEVGLTEAQLKHVQNSILRYRRRYPAGGSGGIKPTEEIIERALKRSKRGGSSHR